MEYEWESDMWHRYCGWKKSCTTLDGWTPINNGINHLSIHSRICVMPQNWFHAKIQQTWTKNWNAMVSMVSTVELNRQNLTCSMISGSLIHQTTIFQWLLLGKSHLKFHSNPIDPPWIGCPLDYWIEGLACRWMLHPTVHGGGRGPQRTKVMELLP